MKYELWIGKIEHSRYNWILVESSRLLRNDVLDSGTELTAVAYSSWSEGIELRRGFVYVMERNYVKIK